ncbi:hypothetical protein BJV78DRAFT_1237680 [Lactifluus subvellereus]|nr:hypothetical protein BJV78DRAFT_1237680 [Lactifluus subvellereus]
MDSVLSVLLSFLRRLRFTGDYIKRVVGRWVLLLAFLGRRSTRSAWLHTWPGEPGTFRLKPRPAEPSFPCARASTTHSVLGGSAVSRENVVAGSVVPAPVSLHEHAPRQTTTTTPSAPSYMHEPLSPPTDHGSRRGQSSSSVIVEAQNPSTESFPITSSTSPPPLTNKPPAIGSPTTYSSDGRTASRAYRPSTSAHVPWRLARPSCIPAEPSFPSVEARGYSVAPILSFIYI